MRMYETPGTPFMVTVWIRYWLVLNLGAGSMLADICAHVFTTNGNINRPHVVEVRSVSG